MAKKNQGNDLLKKAEERARRKAEEIKAKNASINKDNAVQSDTQEPVMDDELDNHSEPVETQVEAQEAQETHSSESIDIPSDMDIPDEIQEELGENFIPDLEVPDDDFDPLKDTVVERGYTDGGIAGETKSTQPQAATPDSASGDIPSGTETWQKFQLIEDPLPEPTINPIESGSADNKTETIGGNESKDAFADKQKAQPINPNLEDLSPSQKRKAAEKSADALITTYSQVVPVPFKYMSSFNMRKLEKRHMNDELDMYMQIMEDGTRVVDYCKDVNDQVESIFVVTEDMKKEIREPLIEVLLEKGVALTPTQRLIMAVGGQILQMGITSIQFLQQNRSAMEQFKQFHEENKESKTKKSEKSSKREIPKEEKKVEKEEDKEIEVEADSLDIPENDNPSGITVEEYLDEK